jgi:hypothetical protein
MKNAHETEDTFWLLFNAGNVLITAEEANRYAQQCWQEQLRKEQDCKKGVFSVSRKAGGETRFSAVGCTMLALAMNPQLSRLQPAHYTD